MKYIYVMGRGHSGSTVFDAMLGNTDSIESVGELVSGMGRLESLCSCGAVMKQCEYWTKVRHRFEENVGYTWEMAVSKSVAQSHLSQFPSTLIRSTEAFSELRTITEYLANSVTRVGGKQAILDSSKTPTRALFLVRNFDDSRVIHLVRNPTGILASNYWRLKHGKGFRFLRRTYTNQKLTPFFLLLSAISWMAGNLLAELVKFIRPQQVFRIRYEDIASEPERLFEELSQFLKLDVTAINDAIANRQTMTYGHNIGAILRACVKRSRTIQAKGLKGTFQHHTI